MALLIANWELILFAILLVVFLVIKVKQFFTHPSKKRQELILIWLVEAVALAEMQYGSKTGALKLSLVYSKFVERFGFVATLISKDIFEELVDKALRIMEETFKEQLSEKQSK